MLWQLRLDKFEFKTIKQLLRPNIYQIKFKRDTLT